MSITVDPTVVVGQPLTLHTRLSGAAGPRTVVVLASTTLGQGPCDARSGLCVDLAGQRTTLDQRTTRNGSWDVTWSPPFTAGTSLWLQAVMLDNGVVRYVDEPQQVDVVANVPGCTFRGSPDFDPAATVDDGSCQCPRVLHVHHPAELTQLSGCSGVEWLTLDGALGGTLWLPDLTFVGAMEIGPATGLTGLHLPALQHGRVSLDQVDGTFILPLPASQDVELSVTSSRGLIAAGTPDGATLGGLRLHDNPNLRWVSVGAGDRLGRTEITGNSALEWLNIGAEGVSSLRVTDNGALTALRLPHLQSVDGLEVSSEDALTTLDLSRLQTAQVMLVIATSITALRLPTLQAVDELYVVANRDLLTIQAPSLTQGHAAITDNVSLCLGSALVTNLPPGMSVNVGGNRCDP